MILLHVVVYQNAANPKGQSNTNYKGLQYLKNLRENFENFSIEILSNNDWRKPIVEFLENPTGIIDRKIKYKALSYMIIGKKLFKKTHEGILLK